MCVEEIHHHHHLAKTELAHLTSSGPTLLEVSVMIFPGFFCLLVCSFLLSSIIYYGAFLLYVATVLLHSCILSKIGIQLISFAISVFVLQSVQVHPAVFLTYFISAAVVLLESLALIVPLSLQYKKARRSSVLYNFILLFFKAFHGLTYCLQCLLFSNIYSIYHCPIIFHKIQNFLK
jgi:hypothetical protein